MEQMEQIVELLRKHERFVLAGHIGPDGDSIGSCFSLAAALSDMGKNVCVLTEPYPGKYNIIPGKQFVFSGNLDKLVPDFKPEVFVALDCADESRLGAAKAVFEQVNFTACIDHHETNCGFAQLNYIEPAASSTSEMTMRVIEKLQTPITKEIATAVYAGIVSDTGGFRFNATGISTMETAAKLMNLGIPFTQIYNELMHRHSFAASKIKGFALEKCERTKDKKVVYTYVTYEMLKSARASTADLDGMVEYLLGTNKAQAAILIYEKTNDEDAVRVKVSLRSHGANMARVAAALGGGGHAMAAGAMTRGNIPDILSITLALVAEEVALYESK